MATVKFKRIANSSTINDYPVDDGTFWITGDGKSYIDYGQNRVPTNGTLDTEISDTSRNAVENSVIKEYIDIELNNLKIELSPKLLWSNPNPTSVFEPQTITLSSNDYDFLEIYYYDWVDTNGYKDLLCQKTIKGRSTKLQMQLTYNNNSYAGNRRILYVNDTTLQVNDNNRIIDNSAFNSTVLNNWNVPVYVIGYKTGLFE